MSKCRKCGYEVSYGRICRDCMKSWKEKRIKAFNQAIIEIGPLNATNLKAIQKRVKQLEKAT